MVKLTESEIAAVLADNVAWRLEDGVLVRDYTFADFKQAMLFVNQVAEVAEQQNHHPDITIKYNGVRLELVSHDAGGLTERDAAMAKLLSK